MIDFSLRELNNLIRYLVATTTLWSGASYIYTKDAVKILSEKDSKESSKMKDQ
jgi:cardiolipin synthase